MKRFAILICAGLVMIASSCDNYLDVNTNPNAATTVDAYLVLPQAQVATALVLEAFNTYGCQIGGYAANAGGYGGFNETVSYKYTPNNYAAGLWAPAYDNLEDYQYIIDKTEGDDLNIFYYGVAKVMRAHNFQLLVDAFNKVPYTEALLGAKMLTPSYDDGAAVYAAIAAELDDAMAAINKGMGLAVVNDISNYDVIFGGDMTSWLQLANTLKLRIMVRGAGKVTFGNSSFDPAGFISSNALINPGYTRDINRQNPKWNQWAYGYTGSFARKSWIPTKYIMAFYDGNTLNDAGRGKAIYYQFPATGTNQLGYEATGIPKCPDGTFWYPGAERVGTAAGDATGPIKGPDDGYPLMIAAESYFLQAEAALTGLVAGNAATLFDAGVTASFEYFYLKPDGSHAGNYTTDAAAYKTNNSTYLVQYGLAANDAERMEAIITQKYLALNMVNSHEGWNEYRRTGYPKVKTLGGVVTQADAATTFASLASQSTRTDRLPSRILYPQSEYQYNPDNVPSGIDTFNSTIFWAK